MTRTITVFADTPSAPKITSVSGGDASITVGFTAPLTDGGSAILGYRLSARPSVGEAVVSSQCDLVARVCSVSGLQNGVDYTVRLAAVNASGTGAEDVAPGSTTPAPVLEAVRNVSGKRNDSTMNVTWQDPESFGEGTFDRYELSIRPEDGSFGTPVTVQSVEEQLSAFDERFVAMVAPVRQYTFTGLDNSKVYVVKIVTITTTSVSAAASNTAAATVLPLDAPSGPRDVVIETADGRTATVSWSSPVSDGGSPLVRYTVAPSTGSCALSSNLATSCEVTGLTPGQSFSVAVRAVNSVGQSAATTESTTLPDTPGAPTIVGATLSGSSVQISWTAPSRTGGRAITSYSASVSASGSTTLRCSTTSLSCLVNGLKTGTSYSIAVRARNSVGDSASSTVFSLSAPSPVVAPISSPATSRTSADATTAWQTYRAESTRVSRALVGLPPAPGKVTVAAAGSRTRVVASGTKSTGGPITRAIITVASKTNRTLARIDVRVSSENPTASITVPYKNSSIKVFVQFANEYGISTGGPVGVNVREGNTFDSTVVLGKAQLLGNVSGDPVYFNAGSAVLTTAGKTQLKTLASSVKNSTGLVYVTGYARLDEVRGWKVDVLARARAEAVAKYLATQGVRQWITFQGAGALKSDWGDWRDRRVVVTSGGVVGQA
ncbi:MAG: hypothetical protein RLZ84_260 [Actinomycetota bacterium]